MKQKNGLLILVIIITFGFRVFSQNENLPDQQIINWHHKDIKLDKLPGISTERTYNELLANKKSKNCIVAIIDVGVDVHHHDLEGIIWINEDEIPNNGIDDDKNGYIDDIHGWNFLGNSSGQNVEFDNWEIVRDYKKLMLEMDRLDTLNLDSTGKGTYDSVKMLGEQIAEVRVDVEKKLTSWTKFYQGLIKSKKLLSAYGIHEETVTLEFLENLTIPQEDTIALKARQYLLLSYKAGYTETKIELIIKTYTNRLLYELNPDYDSREIVGDDPTDFSDRSYGNPDVVGPDPAHGTEIAGIIGARRLNDIGIDGITNNLKIMVIRAVPSGDERDKDIANAICYAVDNGANIINISFGKSANHHEAYMDNALRYAEKNGVLIIRAATNLGQDSDVYPMHPDKFYADGSECLTMISVGASTMHADTSLIWNSSDYGKHSVDLMAPGEKIYTLFPENQTIVTQGTSIASPIVVGVAALIWSYFPELTALEVKEILLNSVEDFGNYEVILPGSKNTKVLFKELSKTGGIVNAYNAFLLAEKKTIK